MSKLDKIINEFALSHAVDAFAMSNFDPNEARDKQGQWTENRSSSKRKKNKLTIQAAAKKLAAKGFQLGKPLAWKPGDKLISYNVTNVKTGETKQLTSKEITELI